LAAIGVDIWRTVGPGAVTVPFINSPYIKLLQGMAKIQTGLFTSKEKTRKWLINEGMRDIKDTMWLFIPAGIAVRRELRRKGKARGIRRDRILRSRSGIKRIRIKR
jgi:hypothetical protein